MVTHTHVRRYLDLDPAVAGVPGVDLGWSRLAEAPDQAAARWRRAGIGRVTLAEPIDLTGEPAADVEANVHRLVLVRELTAHAIAVDWRVVLSADGVGWPAYGHLQPPAELTLCPPVPESTAAEILTAWRGGHYLDACVYRRGPGFLQVRDRRWGKLSLITIDDPAYLAVVEATHDGTRAVLDPRVVADLVAETLVTRVGDMNIWLPYRVRRWPLPATAV